MFHLYIKTHNVTGLKYLGKTIQDPFKYKGSGTRWRHHIRKHGYDVCTEIIGSYNSLEDLIAAAIPLSIEWNIVADSTWANLRIEQGDGGDTSEFIDYKKLNRGKGLTYEERYGIERAAILRRNRRETLGKNSSKRKGKTLIELYGAIRSEQIINRNIKAHKGVVKGPLSEQHKKAISKAKTGKPFNRTICPHCNVSIGLNNISRHLTSHVKPETC